MIGTPQCFTCDKYIQEGQGYYEWVESYCSKECLIDAIKCNMDEVIDEISNRREA